MSESKYSVDYRFKILYAIGMILVCCDHTGGGGISLFTDWFPYGGTHLALFMFSSGYFYKSASEDQPGSYVLRKVKSLLIPYYIYNLCYGLLVSFLKTKGFGIGGDFTAHNLILAPVLDGSHFVYNMGGWFIFPLFLVEILNLFLRKALRMWRRDLPERSFFFLSMAIGLVGNQLAANGLHSGYWLVLTRVCYFLPFYAFGSLYHRVLEKYDDRIPDFPYLGMVMFAKLFLFLYAGRVISYNPAFCNNFKEGPFMPILIGFLGIAFWFRIARILESSIGRSPFINAIADNTFSIMMNQFLGFMLLKGACAFAHKYFGIFADFKMSAFKNDIWWYYMPRGLPHTLLLYVAAGILFSIGLQCMLDWMKKGIISIFAGKDR